MEPDEYVRPRSMADLVVEQATAAPGEYRATVAPSVCPTCGQQVPAVASTADTVVDL